MSGVNESFFVSYEEWRDAMDNRCKIALTPEYCDERINALQDPKDPSTAQFLKRYGSAYRDIVIAWFKKAGAGN